VTDSEKQPNPKAVLVKNGDRWKIELQDFAAFRDQLGADVLNAFCRCFVHADRLQSLASLVYVSESHQGKDSVAFERNLQTMVPFAAGTLRELAYAIRTLQAALKKRDWLDLTNPHWAKLRDVGDRWTDDASLRTTRDTMAFHVDENVIEQGIQALIRDKAEVSLSESDERDVDSVFLTIGLLALINGAFRDVSDYARLAETVGKDQSISNTLQDVFILALRSAGIPYGTE